MKLHALPRLKLNAWLLLRMLRLPGLKLNSWLLRRLRLRLLLPPRLKLIAWLRLSRLRGMNWHAPRSAWLPLESARV